MSGDQTDSLVVFRRAYGKVVPPDKITQEAFEGDDRHLRRLVRLKAEERADADDLWKYLQDLRYTKIQGSLLAHALPFCLDLWREDLRGVDGYGGFVEHLYPVLANCNIFKEHLTRKQSAAVSDFMQEAILQEIDAIREGFPIEVPRHGRTDGSVHSTLMQFFVQISGACGLHGGRSKQLDVRSARCSTSLV